MEENLVGYLLNALDADTQRKVEDYLRDSPQGRKQVERLRQALAPLETDKPEIEPPEGLAVRTLACVAEYCCRDLPRAPLPSRRWSDAPPRRWWRRADVLVAASLFLCIALLIPPVVSHLQHQHQLETCKNNLNKFGQALMVYSQNNGNAFPNVADAKLPRHVAGMVVPVLFESKALPPDSVSVRCPGNGPAVQCPTTLEELKKLSDEEFKALAPRLSGCYAYSLGYADQDGGIHGYSSRDPYVPIMADRPPFRGEGSCSTEGNSPNHGGLGQNVLFTDGHVTFLKNRMYQGDDIFLNKDKRVRPGIDPDDFVLGVSEAEARP